MAAGGLGAQSSHLAAFSGIPILGSDGAVVGSLMHVLTTGPAEVLEGIVIEARVGGGGARYVDAPQIAAFYERGVTLRISGEGSAELPRPQPPPTVADVTAPVATGLDAKLRRAWEVLAGEPGS